MTDRWKDFVRPEFNRDIPPPQISYWQIGCNDAKAGRPYNMAMQHANGYDQGYRYGAGDSRFPWQRTDREPIPVVEPKPMPQPLLKNPYMEGIEAV